MPDRLAAPLLAAGLALSLAACGIKQETHQAALDRIAALEVRLAAAEARLATLEEPPAAAPTEPAADAGGPDDGGPEDVGPDDEHDAWLDAVVTRVDDTTVRLKRDAVLDDPMRIAKTARVVPAVEDGKRVGYKLYAIRPSSLWARVGFRNGDTVAAINGHDLTDPDDGFELYQRLFEAPTLTVEVIRRDATVTLTIHLQ